MTYRMTRLLLNLTLCTLITLALATEGQAQESNSPEYRKAIEILERVPLIDGHNDIPWQYDTRFDHKLSGMDFHDTSDIEPAVHTDILRLREGRVGGQFWSVYVSADLPEPEAIQATMEQIDFAKQLIAAWPEHLELVTTADGIEEAFDRGRIASLLGMEGGHSIGNSVMVLRQFYELGARYMTLTHSRTLDWADASPGPERHDGLTSFGEEVVREMNRLGMLVDLSHVSESTMMDAIRVSEAPVIFSHSSARGVSNHHRNVPDSVLDRIEEEDGVVMVTFVPSFVSEALRQYYEDRSAAQERFEREFDGNRARIQSAMENWRAENPMPESTLDQVADHIDHIRDRIGTDHIGIGGDYDGITSTPRGLEDVSTYPVLFAELLRRGYSEEDLEQIAGKNLIRVFRKAEAVARELQQQRGPSEARITDE
ncbi:MAG: dipeptidase [Bacteroidota bacterium]